MGDRGPEKSTHPRNEARNEARNQDRKLSSLSDLVHPEVIDQ